MFFARHREKNVSLDADPFLGNGEESLKNPLRSQRKMATQLKMFEGVRGNKVGEYGWEKDCPASDHFEAPSKVDSLTLPESFRPMEPIEEIETFPVVQSSEPKPAATHVSQPANPVPLPIRFISETHISDLHRNPYDPASSASICTRIWAFILRSFKE